MELNDLQELFDQASKLTNHREFVVVGSLSILGLVQGRSIPTRMLMSIDVDCYTRQDPGRIFELQQALGESSAFAAAHGFYLDPISPDLPTLPDGWEPRLLPVPLRDGITVYFLDPNDAAVAKYARSEPRDRAWIQAGLAAGLLSVPIIDSRFRTTTFLDADEERRARKAFAEDRAALTSG